MIEEGGKALAAYLKPREERSEEHTSELQSQSNLVCRLLLEKKKQAELLAVAMLDCERQPVCSGSKLVSRRSHNDCAKTCLWWTRLGGDHLQGRVRRHERSCL